MLISIKWLKDFVNLDGIKVKEIIKRIGLSTAEIEDVYEYGKDFSGVVVAEIKEVKKHPDSKKLSILKVDNGEEVVQVLCGAPNVRVGLKTMLAKPGAVIKGHKISVATLAGYESNGMCCGADELGIGEDKSGIIELSDEAPVGKDVKDVYDIEDTVFEIDNKSLTNRPDLWGHYGIAREVAAIFKRELKPLNIDEIIEADTDAPSVEIDTKNCFRYTAIKLDNVTRKKSPVNMQIRLHYCGIRAINFLADITNYILLELGQPAHAFDSEKIDKIVVKQPSKEIEFTTLDGELRKIKPSTMLIHSNDTPIAMAGIMGGLDSEITDKTTSVLLESATFDAASIRRSAAYLNLRTEASARYEKSLDPELALMALKRMVTLITQNDIKAKVSSAIADVYPKPYKKIVIKTSKKFICDYIGINFTVKEIEDVLKRLEFKVNTLLDESFEIEVPTFRATKDVSIAADIVEEISRIYGYDNIVAKPIKGIFEPVAQKIDHVLEYEAKKILAEEFSGVEVHSYLWNDVKANKNLNIKTKGYVKVLNSTVKDNDEIRSELVPTLLKMVNENKKTQDDMNIFEIGRVVSGLNENKNAKEEKRLAIALSSKNLTEEKAYFGIKERLESLANKLFNVSLEYEIGECKNNYYHPVNNASVFYKGKKIGQIGLLHPLTASKIGDKFVSAVAEIYFDEFCKIKPKKITITPVSKFQRNVLDLNFMINKDKSYKEIKAALNNIKTELNYNLTLKDIYVNENKEDSDISYTFSYELWAEDHTLTSEEIENFMTSVIKTAKNYNFNLKK